MDLDHRFDLHSHSSISDGTFTPAEMVRMAARAKLSLFAVTDHDCMDGVAQALQTGKEVGVPILPGMEIDTDWTFELHILGLGVDIENAALQEALEIARERRVPLDALKQNHPGGAIGVKLGGDAQ